MTTARTFIPDAIHRATYKGRRITVKYESLNLWHIAGVGYVAEIDLQDISPAIEPPVLHKVNTVLFGR